MLLQAASLILLARTLGAQGYGDLSGSLAIFITLGQLCGFGVGSALVRRVSRDGGGREWLWAARRVYAVSGLALFLPSWALAVVLFGDIVPPAALAALAFAELIAAPALMPDVYLQQARERLFVSGGLLTMAPLARVLAAGLAFALGDGSLLWFSLAYASCLAITACVALAIVRERGQPPPARRIRLGIALREGAPFAFGSAAATAGSELDKSVLLHALGGVAAGHYSAAHRLIQAATLPVNSLVLAATPRLFRVAGPEGHGSLGRHLLAGAAGYAVVAAACLWLFAPWLVWILGSDFRDATELLRWMVPLVVASSVRQVVMARLTTLDRQMRRNLIEVIASVVSVGSMFALVPRFGVMAVIAVAGLVDTACCIAGALSMNPRACAQTGRA